MYHELDNVYLQHQPPLGKYYAEHSQSQCNLCSTHKNVCVTNGTAKLTDFVLEFLYHSCSVLNIVISFMVLCEESILVNDSVSHIQWILSSQFAIQQ